MLGLLPLCPQPWVRGGSVGWFVSEGEFWEEVHPVGRMNNSLPSHLCTCVKEKKNHFVINSLNPFFGTNMF